MSKTTNPITYHYDVAGHTISVARRHVGTAYARNGNAHNPTEYFVWEARVDGQLVGTGYDTRATAYEYARASALGIKYRQTRYARGRVAVRGINERLYTIVQDEMRANYRGRTAQP